MRYYILEAKLANLNNDLKMENEKSNKNEKLALEKEYELLEQAATGRDITVRDEHHDFYWMLDLIKFCRGKGSRFRLIDTGVFDCSHLEWLAAAGADLYTSDKVRQEIPELELIHEASKKGKALMAFFYYDNLKEEVEEGALSLSGLLNIGRSGIYIHLTNRNKKRDFSQLNQLAYYCRTGGSWFVYYHHGDLDFSLVELGDNGAWIHVSDQSIQNKEDSILLLDVVKSARSVGTNLVLYLERGVDFIPVNDIVKAGGLVFFKSGHIDYKSPFKPLEEKVGRKKLDFRAYYLYPTFMH